MRLWYNTGFKGVEPTNTAAIVQARTAEDAAAMLSAHLVPNWPVRLGTDIQ